MFLFFLATFECNFCHLPEIGEHKQSQQSWVPKSLFWDSPRATLRVVKFSCSLGTGNDRIMLWLYYCNPQKIEKKEGERIHKTSHRRPIKYVFCPQKIWFNFAVRITGCLDVLFAFWGSLYGWCWAVRNINDPLWHYL